MENRINTSTEQTINETLQVNQQISNRERRFFTIAALNENFITLQPTNGETNRPLTMSRKVFVQLYYRKNYTQIFTNNPLRESIEAYRTGATRFMVG